MMSNEKELPIISNEMAGGDRSERHLLACQIVISLSGAFKAKPTTH